MSDLYAVIIAGGRGTRFWPRSRAHLPKQCLAVDGGRTLIQRTVDRIAPLVAPDRVYVITASSMADTIRGQLPELPPENVLVEPTGRNTAPCVAWGTRLVQERASDDAVVCVLPADHIIADEAGFRDCLARAADAARDSGALVTLGIRPTHPETGFGYLELEADGEVCEVKRFVEKPDAETAAGYLACGRYLWNAGMFVFTAGAMASELERQLPTLWAGIRAIVAEPDRLADDFGRLQKISIDYGVMEGAARVLTVPADIGWSDVGSWAAVADHLPETELGPALVGHAVAVDARDNVVHAPDKLVALVGVDGLVVVDAGDALLVCPREQAQRVREVVDRLERDELTAWL